MISGGGIEDVLKMCLATLCYFKLPWHAFNSEVQHKRLNSFTLQWRVSRQRKLHPRHLAQTYILADHNVALLHVYGFEQTDMSARKDVHTWSVGLNRRCTTLRWHGGMFQSFLMYDANFSGNGSRLQCNLKGPVKGNFHSNVWCYDSPQWAKELEHTVW